MLVKIEKLAALYLKRAQQITVELPSGTNPAELSQPLQEPVYRNHVIRINQQAEELQRAINYGIQVGTTRAEARSYSDGLKNIAVRLTAVVQGGGNPEEEQRLIQELFRMYNTIATHYVDRRYEPMEQIGVSLAYIAAKVTAPAAPGTAPPTPGQAPTAPTA